MRGILPLTSSEVNLQQYKQKIGETYKIPHQQLERARMLIMKLLILSKRLLMN